MGIGVGVGVGVAVEAGMAGVAVGVGMGIAVEVGIVVTAVGVEMGVAGEAVCEQPITTGRTKAMAIPTANNSLGRMSDAAVARAYPYLVCTRVGDNEILRHARNHYGLGEATQGDENGSGKRASVAS